MNGVTLESGLLPVSCWGTAGAAEASGPCGHCRGSTLPLGTLSPSLRRTLPGRSRKPFGKLSEEWGHVSDVTWPCCSWECVCKTSLGGGGIEGQRAAAPCASLPPALGALLQIRVWPGPRRPEPAHVWVSRVIPDVVLQLDEHQPQPHWPGCGDLGSVMNTLRRKKSCLVSFPFS